MSAHRWAGLSMTTVSYRLPACKSSSDAQSKKNEQSSIVGDPRGWHHTAPKYDRSRELLSDYRLQIRREMLKWCGFRYDIVTTTASGEVKTKRSKPRINRCAMTVLREIMDAGDAPERGQGDGVVVRNSFLLRFTLADRAGYSIKSVDRGLAELHLAGVLSWERVAGRGSRYIVHFPDEVIEAATGERGQSAPVHGESDGQDCPTIERTVSQQVRHFDAHTYPYSPNPNNQTPPTKPKPEPQPEPAHEPRDRDDQRSRERGEGGDSFGLIEKTLAEAGLDPSEIEDVRARAPFTNLTIDQVRYFVQLSPEKNTPKRWLRWACMHPDRVPLPGGKTRKPSLADKAKAIAQSEPAQSEIKSERLDEAMRLSESVRPRLEAMRRPVLHDLIAWTLRRMTHEGLSVIAYIDLDRWGPMPIDIALRVDPLSEERNAIALRAAIAKRIEAYPGKIEYQTH